MPKILVVTPTRGRPENVKRLRASLDRKAQSQASFDHLVCIDEDDPRLDDYMKEASDPTNHYVVGTPKRLGPWLNEVAKTVEPFAYDIIAFIGDDVVARTWGWDFTVREAMKPNGIVYCNDGWQGEGLPTAVFMDTEMVKKAGYMVYPELIHLYIDNHWKVWGEALGTLTYLPGIYLEHMHPFAGKAETDAVYEAANHPDMYSSDGQAFHRFVEEELERLVISL